MRKRTYGSALIAGALVMMAVLSLSSCATTDSVQERGWIGASYCKPPRSFRNLDHTYDDPTGRQLSDAQKRHRLEGAVLVDRVHDATPAAGRFHPGVLDSSCPEGAGKQETSRDAQAANRWLLATRDQRKLTRNCLRSVASLSTDSDALGAG